MKQRLALIFWLVIIPPLDLAVWIWMALSIIFSTTRATAIANGYDVLGNIAMGQGRETISSWTGRHNSWAEPMINKLFEWLGEPPGHCDRNRETDK